MYDQVFRGFAALFVEARYRDVEGEKRKVREGVLGDLRVQVIPSGGWAPIPDARAKKLSSPLVEITFIAIVPFPHRAPRPAQFTFRVFRMGSEERGPAELIRDMASFVRARKRPLIPSSRSRTRGVATRFDYRELAWPYHDAKMTILNGPEIADLLDSIAQTM